MTTGRVFQINLSKGGVPKLAVPQANLTPLELEGDRHNSHTHGGLQRALCIYSLERIQALQAEGHPIFPGATGENLTLSGINWDAVTPGVVLQIGTQVRVEVTEYTEPCPKITAAFNGAEISRMAQAKHPGWSRVYAKVLQPGLIRAGDAVTLVRPADNEVEKSELWEGVPPASAAGDDFRPWLERYPVRTQRPLGTVLVCPGGGYVGRAPHEAAPIAERFNASGMQAFVVQYRVAPNRHPAPLLDVSRAMRIIRHRAAEWQVDPTRIAVIGFSAGGHLTASLGVHYELPELSVGDDLDAISARPDALILSYAVISSGARAHRGSFENLLGPDASAEMIRKMSLELHVTEQTPPTFLWHTADDAVVPVENSLRFAAALRDHGVSFELHVYPSGVHGLGLAPAAPHTATWMELCCEWLHGMGW